MLMVSIAIILHANVTMLISMMVPTFINFTSFLQMWVHSTQSLVGVFLYALYVAPLQDLTECILFADDNFPMETSKEMTQLLLNLKNCASTHLKSKSFSNSKYFLIVN